ncbi:hypothetical protein [Brevibacillus sp. H7]|uniref:hypothetical protein n=1 Tax=Brevibacillus sp. H7 TaxID=3349138 RepID=UPI00380FDC3E
MFFHGINWEYVLQVYPILSPRRGVSRKRGDQLEDRQHLLERFGLEPVHLLEASHAYPAHRCLGECLAFGDTVFAFQNLPDPLWQLSSHEVGVKVLDLRTCCRIYTARTDADVARWFPNVVPTFIDDR